MSKLFDQLKDAARSREERSPGLLAEALQRKAAGGSAPAPEPQPDAFTPPQAPAPSRLSSFSGIALAVLIFVVAIAAWHSTPFRVPQKYRIDPSGLKLDRTLDVDRITPKGTSPAGRPS